MLFMSAATLKRGQNMCITCECVSMYTRLCTGIGNTWMLNLVPDANIVTN